MTTHTELASSTPGRSRRRAVLASITAAALAVNGAFVGAEAVPAMLVLMLWTLVTGAYLFITGRSVVVLCSRAERTLTGRS